MSVGYREALEALKKLDTPELLTAKTAKTTIPQHNTSPSLRGTPIEGDKKSQTPKPPTAKTAETPAEHLGLVSTWADTFGFVSIHDPVTGEWHDLQTKDAPEWTLWEARKRKELYRVGNRKAYRLTSREMEEIWEAERPITEEGIVEEYPVEEEDE